MDNKIIIYYVCYYRKPGEAGKMHEWPVKSKNKPNEEQMRAIANKHIDDDNDGDTIDEIWYLGPHYLDEIDD